MEGASSELPSQRPLRAPRVNPRDLESRGLAAGSLPRVHRSLSVAGPSSPRSDGFDRGCTLVSIGGIGDWSHAPPGATPTPSRNWSRSLMGDPAGELPRRAHVMGRRDRKGVRQVRRGSEIRRKRNSRNVSETSFEILGLAASLRRASIHRGLLRAAQEVCPEGMACESFDLGFHVGATAALRGGASSVA
jgi:hypothetical protein